MTLHDSRGGAAAGAQPVAGTESCAVHGASIQCAAAQLAPASASLQPATIERPSGRPGFGNGRQVRACHSETTFAARHLCGTTSPRRATRESRCRWAWWTSSGAASRSTTSLSCRPDDEDRILSTVETTATYAQAWRAYLYHKYDILAGNVATIPGN